MHVSKYLKLCCFLICLPFLCGASLTSRVKTFGYWNYAPEVYNCQDSPYSEQEVISAIEFWQMQGFVFGYLHESHDCVLNPPSKGIMIETANRHTFSNYPSNLARTFTVYNGLNQIIFSDIQILTKRDRVLEHELGHALGFRHYDKRQHIMNSIWQDGGWKTDGLFKNQKL